MIHRLYEYLLMREITTPPREICFMLTVFDLRSAPERINDVVRWAEAVPGIGMLTFHIDTDDLSCVTPFIEDLKAVSEHARLELHLKDEVFCSGEGLPVLIVVGRSGREEITESIQKIADEGIDPCDLTEETIESHLTFRSSPDLIIKTGGSYLTDFLIWQSVYSELFFLDVNWEFFRKTDLLRAIRDFQSRARRFGA
ncbi:MAG: Undecaprenyl pyrophosphate synthetase [Methanomicrobiales archaeon 53_19]|jgi:undecaprenyl diphosphate synthase|uniref:undecaprenyl diphosphate synthase family protein n=1 Tax=Methanocalculus sp. TaxID=2004547 RepID=UPI00074887E2|nr:undecaprenyl diphosphate synthase family protein [Methanocalculus sp.]KUL04633.1 MAG: Undecaprenyl pyrophosphate synthetase [Methanomicrobiales archaeon 53_19]HIJ06854.1 undecaprenyl diphosphate synthase family protein [Methanocalculus sp.]